MRLRLILTSYLCMVASAACGGSPEEAVRLPEFSERDSSGVRIVEITDGAFRALEEWSADDVPSITIGEAAGEDPYLLTRVAAARRLASGEIVIADGQSLELRLFGPDGSFIRKYAKEGSGPGEFRSFAAVGHTDGVNLPLWDEPLGRITRIDLTTGHASTAPAPRCGNVGSLGSCSVAGLFPGGGVVAVQAGPRGRMPRDAELAIRPGATRLIGVLRGDSLVVADSVRGPASVVSGAFTSNLFTGTALFEVGGLVVFGSEEWVVADPHRYELRWRDTAGVLRQIVRAHVQPQPVTAELLREYRDWADTASYIPQVAHEYLASLDPGGSIPFFGRAILDRAGRVWLSEYEPFWAFGPRGVPSWTVIAADGRPLAVVPRMPRGDILEIGDDYVLLLTKDDLGVERVQLHRVGTREDVAGSAF